MDEIINILSLWPVVKLACTQTYEEPTLKLYVVEDKDDKSRTVNISSHCFTLLYQLLDLEVYIEDVSALEFFAGIFVGNLLWNMKVDIVSEGFNS